jgi:hypothetical protein
MHRTVQQYRALLAAQPANLATDAFEASTMYLCTAAGRRSRNGPASVPGLVTDFDSAAAAMRFRAMLARYLGDRAWVEPVVCGIRHSFEVYRVMVVPGRRADAANLLAGAWREAAATITDPQPLSATSPRWRRRQDLAIAAWRGMLLACAPVRTSQALRVRLPQVDLATLAVRCARLLGVATHARYAHGLAVVSVDDQPSAFRLLASLANAEPGQPTAVLSAPMPATGVSASGIPAVP